MVPQLMNRERAGKLVDLFDPYKFYNEISLTFVADLLLQGSKLSIFKPTKILFRKHELKFELLSISYGNGIMDHEDGMFDIIKKAKLNGNHKTSKIFLSCSSGKEWKKPVRTSRRKKCL